ncbi:MAG: hypothetical protein mread185_000380 [Mycoplasmataceae bacterium]|nr:MAG: hypothetical protein mread185_000380 [Mycoplasmataceae bacterium]
MGNNQSSNQSSRENSSFFSDQEETFKELRGPYGKIYKVLSRSSKENYRK